jgi:hypothetical protein
VLKLATEFIVVQRLVTRRILQSHNKRPLHFLHSGLDIRLSVTDGVTAYHVFVACFISRQRVMNIDLPDVKIFPPIESGGSLRGVR